MHPWWRTLLVVGSFKSLILNAKRPIQSSLRRPLTAWWRANARRPHRVCFQVAPINIKKSLDDKHQAIMMIAHCLLLLIAAPWHSTTAFAPLKPSRPLARQATVLDAKARKAKKKVDRSRPQQFYDAINEAQGKTATKEPEDVDAEREQRQTEAQRRMDERPDVSTMRLSMTRQELRLWRKASRSWTW